MHFAEETVSGRYRISAYGPEQIWVNGSAVRGSLLISVDQLIVDWRPDRIADLRAEDFAAIRHWKAEVLLLGTGDRLEFPSPETYRTLVERGIAVEIMDTAAACRTYNILAGDSRPVAAALLPLRR